MNRREIVKGIGAVVASATTGFSVASFAKPRDGVFVDLSEIPRLYVEGARAHMAQGAGRVYLLLDGAEYDLTWPDEPVRFPEGTILRPGSFMWKHRVHFRLIAVSQDALADEDDNEDTRDRPDGQLKSSRLGS